MKKTIAKAIVFFNEVCLTVRKARTAHEARLRIMKLRGSERHTALHLARLSFIEKLCLALLKKC